MSDRLRVVVVDDHDVVRAGIKALLSKEFEVIGEADDVDGAVDVITARRPDIVTLDVKLPGGGGAAVVETIKATNPEIKFMALTVSTSKGDVAQLLQAGVDGYITKSTLGSQLCDYLKQTFAGERPVSPDVAAYLLDIDEDIATNSYIARLTPKEREVVGLVARGYSYREAADRLGISVKTVDSHITKIFDKLRVASRHQLTALAYDEGYLRPDDV